MGFNRFTLLAVFLGLGACTDRNAPPTGVAEPRDVQSLLTALGEPSEGDIVDEYIVVFEDLVGDPREEAEDIMDLARGKWICLTRNISIPNLNNPVTQYNVYHWYRIQSVDEVYVDGTNYEINVSIQGPDWQHSAPTQAIYIRSVVGVYERKVRLESLSKWTP